MSELFSVLFIIMGCLLFVVLGWVFLISRKYQNAMQSLLEIVSQPDQAKIQSATRVLHALLKDEISKIDNNFQSLSMALQEQIQRTEQIKQELSTQNDKIVDLADNASKKIANTSQRLENTVEGLQGIVNSSAWQDVQNIADNFSANVEMLMNKITETTATTTENANQINAQIVQSIDNEKQISEQLQSSFAANNQNMIDINNSAVELQQRLIDLSTSVTDGFNNIKASSTDYDETMHKNDKLLNDYLTKLSEFTKRSGKELIRQANTLTETANIVASAVRLAEASIDKQIRKLESTIESLNNSTTNTQTSVRGVANELTGLTNKFNGEIHDFSTGVVKELQDVSGVANTTLENTKNAAMEFANSVKSMGAGVRETLIEMNKAHTQLSGQSENLIKMSQDTTEQLKPLSELIERYYQALPDLSAGSKEMSENIEQIVNTLVEKIGLMKTTLSESLDSMNNSSTQLGNLAGESRQQMIDLMSDYAKAVDAMQSLNKQMVIARATAPMDAIKEVPVQKFATLSTKDFLANTEKLFEKLYAQSVDLTRASGAEIPDIIWKKYNSGDNKIFAKWLSKMFAASDKKQIKELLKNDKVFASQAAQFMRNFEKILNGAEQTDDATKVKTAILKTDLGTIYSAINKNI